MPVPVGGDFSTAVINATVRLQCTIVPGTIGNRLNFTDTYSLRLF